MVALLPTESYLSARAIDRKVVCFLLPQEKALTETLRIAVKRLDAQLMHVCTKGPHRSQHVESRDAQTQVQHNVEEGGNAVAQEELATALVEYPSEQEIVKPEVQELRTQVDIDNQGIGQGSVRAEGQIVSRAGREVSNWAHASCQIGWSESVSDKSCQAHDIEAATSRLRWAARDILKRRFEKSTWQNAIQDAKRDMRIANQVLQLIATNRAKAVEQVTAAKRAKQEYLERRLHAMRHDGLEMPSPLTPLVLETEREETSPPRRRGCFSTAKGNANESTGALANQRKRVEDYAESGAKLV